MQTHILMHMEPFKKPLALPISSGIILSPTMSLPDHLQNIVATEGTGQPRYISIIILVQCAQCSHLQICV